MPRSTGSVLRRARQARGLSAADVAVASGISAAYLSKLESDTVRKPSPLVLFHLGEALGLRYGDLMRLAGYPVPEGVDGPSSTPANGPFDNLTEEEHDELLEYLAWFRSRRRLRRSETRIPSTSR